ncbi:MAG: glycosyltransferase [Candidatus Doudnabacteria bacterium]
MKKILILYTSVGLGHKYIALNIGKHLENAGYTVKLEDVLQLQSGSLVSFSTWLHGFVNRRLPFVWRWLYFSQLVTRIGLMFRLKVARSHSQHVKNIVDEFSPDMVITTQTTATAAMVSLKERGFYSGQLGVGFSDYHFHRLWFYKQADFYLVNIPEQKEALIKLGYPEEQIVICGITLEQKRDADLIALRNEYKIPAENKIVLFGVGSLGIGFDTTLLFEFLNLTSEFKEITVVVFCGKNTELYKLLKQQRFENVIALPFIDNIKDWYQAADLFITKPGGLTVAESLQAGLKILVTHTLPGQEEPNYDYLLSHDLIFPKPNKLNAQSLKAVMLKALQSPKLEFNQTSQLLTQFGEEGKTLVNKVNNQFHKV